VVGSVWGIYRYEVHNAMVCICPACREWRSRYVANPITVDEVIDVYITLKKLEEIEGLIAWMRDCVSHNATP
jgi:hypothetical protein